MRKVIFLILMVFSLSGCIYNKDELIQVTVSEHISVAPSTNAPKVVFKFNDNYDYTLNFVMDKNIFARWENVNTGEILDIQQIAGQSVFQTKSAIYGLIFLTPYDLVVMTNGEPVQFTIIGLTKDELIMSMNFQGGVYLDTYKRVIENGT